MLRRGRARVGRCHGGCRCEPGLNYWADDFASGEGFWIDVADRVGIMRGGKWLMHGEWKCHV